MIEMAADPQTTLDSNSLPSSQKHEVIDAYLRKERSREEMDLLEIEMKQTLDSLKHKQNTQGTCNTLKQSNDQFSQGAHCILTKTMLKYEQIIEKTKKELKTKTRVIVMTILLTVIVILKFNVGTCLC